MPVSLDPIQIDNSTTATTVNGSNGESDLCFFYWKVIWCIVDVHALLTNNNNNKKAYSVEYDFYKQLSFYASHFDNPFTYPVISFSLTVMRSAAEWQS